MIRKISIIIFIFLTIFLIDTASATELENETIPLQSEIPENIHIETQDVEMFYKDGTRFRAEIRDMNENPLNHTQLIFGMNNASYQRQTNENGEASIALNLNSGKYNVTTTVKGISVKNTVNIKSTIYSDDVVKIYRNSTQYYAKFLKSTGEDLKNTCVTFNINGVFYTRTTDESGIAKLNINLEHGKYIITAINGITGEMASNNITVLPTITNNNDVVKYYRNGTKYTVTILEKNATNTGRGHDVEFNINGVFYHRQTNDLGIASLNLNLNPGNYIITANYEGCRVSNNIKILPTLTARNMEMEYRDGTKFIAHVVDGTGKPNAYEKVTFNMNGVFYTRTTNENGDASLNVNLQPGEYIITSENNGLYISNSIKIYPQKEKEAIKNTEFTYEIKIPSYVNVTFPYVYSGTYAIKSGIDGIIRMEKELLLEIQIDYKNYFFSTAPMPEYNAKYLGGEYYLLPFDSSPMQHSYSYEKLTGYGIILYKTSDYVNIIYRNNCSDNIEQFGAYIDKSIDNGEIINYIQNGESKAKIKFQSMGFDETGLKHTLSIHYGKTIYDFNQKSYFGIIGEDTSKIRFVNTNESVTFNYFGRKISGYLSEENVTTKFNSNNCIEFEKSELITYGLSKKYKQDFDVLHSFAIINGKITNNILKDWINKENEYKANVGMQSTYAMFLTSLNTAYLSDKLSDNLTKDNGLKWSRTKNTVILGGMNWKETYQHILTPDMGRSITGDNESDIIKFNFVNSILLSKIEEASLTPIARDADVNMTSVFDDVFNSLASYKATIVYYNNTAIISDEKGNSSFIINLKTGLVTPLSIHDGFAYKGTTITRDCGLCSIDSMAKEILQFVNNGISWGNDILNHIRDNLHPITSTALKAAVMGKGIIGAILGSGLAVGLGVLGTALGMQSIGVYIADNFVDDKDLHNAYDHFTFTRPGYLQNVKIYNIPHDDGSMDYLEVPINKDNSLNRNDVKYISNGNVRTLSTDETYQYFTEETWDPYNVPQKYWR